VLVLPILSYVHDASQEGFSNAFCDIATPLLKVSSGSSVEMGSRSSSPPHFLIVFRSGEEKHDENWEDYRSGDRLVEET
jgi:hypothetical protein